MNYRVPGKTFLVGEYSVLLGGAALGVATKPYFEFNFQKEFNLFPSFQIHAESPAGLYLRAHQVDQQIQQQVAFLNPYLSQGVLGGFGQSTAEYLAVYANLNQGENLNSFDQIREEYQSLHRNKKNPPSGVDLAFQYYGEVCLARPAEKNYQSGRWPFLDLDFFLVATGVKVATHQHLLELDLDELTLLPEQSEKVIEAFLQKKSSRFVDELKNWVHLLHTKKLTHSYSVDLRMQIEKNKKVLSVKPCGALGADVLLVLFESGDQEEVKKSLSALPLQIVARADDLCEGFYKNIQKKVERT